MNSQTPQLFSTETESLIFHNKELLNWDWVPDDIHYIQFRNDQYNMLKIAFSKLIAKSTIPSFYHLYGAPGTGKTLLVKFMINLFRRETGANEKADIIYVNCRRNNTEYDILRNVIADFLSISYQGTNLDTYYKGLENYIKTTKKKIMMVLDDIDELTAPAKLIFKLHRLNEDISGLSMILISNSLEFWNNMDARTRSSFNTEELIFYPYNALQLGDILKNRIGAFKPDVLEQGVIEKCAALIAQEHGDARRALAMLRTAGEIAEQRKSAKVKIEYVDMAQELNDLDAVVSHVKFMPRQQKVLLSCLIEMTSKNQKIKSTEIYDQYYEKCKNNGIASLSVRSLRDFMAEFSTLGIVDIDTSMDGRYGKRMTVSTHLSDITIKKIKNLFCDLY